MAERSSYQQGIIRRYYENRQSIALGKLGELVSELYLADSEKKQDRLWERVRLAMASLGVPDKVALHVLAQRDVKVLARNLQDWAANPPK